MVIFTKAHIEMSFNARYFCRRAKCGLDAKHREVLFLSAMSLCTHESIQ